MLRLDLNMKSLTFWLPLVGILVAWRVVAGFEGESAPSDYVLKSEFDFYVGHSKAPVLVNFSRHNCSGSKKVHGLTRRLEEKIRGKATVYEVNIDKHPEVAARFGIASIPSLVIFDKGIPVERLQTTDQKVVRERLLSYVD